MGFWSVVRRGFMRTTYSFLDWGGFWLALAGSGHAFGANEN
jgi:hypothetical protein